MAKANKEAEEANKEAEKKRFFAAEDFFGSRGMTSVSFKKGQEIKDVSLALHLMGQGNNIEIR